MQSTTVTMKSRSASLFFLLFLPVLLVAAVRKGPLVGGWKTIDDVKDTHVQEIGKFAVDQYNAQSKGRLVFKSVVSGETQVVSGTNYRLVVRVLEKKGGSVTNYQAIVWEKPWENFKKLTSFQPARNSGGKP